MSQPVSDDIDRVLEGQERWYAPVEIAHILGLAKTTVQELCRSGRIHAVKVNNQWRVTKRELRRYIDEGPNKE